MVITPKYCGKILVGDVALVVDGIIRTTCKEMKIEIIDMAVKRVNRSAQALYLSAGYSDFRIKENKHEMQKMQEFWK